MPLGSIAVALNHPLTWTNSEIGRVIENFFSERGASILKNQALIARMFVKESQSRFKRPADGNDLFKSGSLLVTGRESIFRSSSCARIFVLHRSTFSWTLLIP